MALITKTYASKSGSGTYTAQLDTATGATSCNCRGWTFKRGDAPRSCSHTKDLQATAAHTAPAGRVELPATVPVSTPPPDATLTGLRPMLASAMTKGLPFSTFETDDWSLEVKFDGHRRIVRKAGDTVLTWSRPGAENAGIGLESPVNDSIRAALAHLPDGLYDGEEIAPNNGTCSDVGRLSTFHQQTLVLFDAVEMLGQDLRGATYTERRAALLLAVAHLPAESQKWVMTGPSVSVKWAAVEAIWAAGGEGAILKRNASTYHEGHRSPDWLKVKRWITATLTVVGFAEGKRGSHSKLELRGDDGTEARVGVLNNQMIRDITADPASYLGRRLVINAAARNEKSGKYREPQFDHWAGIGE